MDLLANTEADFEIQLTASLEKWKQEGARSIQIFFKPPKCHLMNVASKHGFYFHHAHQQEDYVLMIKWTDGSMADQFPRFADHYVGVGGVMVNDKEEILLIQEHKNLGYSKQTPWKFPGGYVECGETVMQGVEREVFEETGLKGEFLGILALREQMDHKYGAADFYIVCMLRPQENYQAIDIIDKHEVKQAKWVPLSAIDDNEDGCEFKLYPNAFEFIKLIKQWLSMNNTEQDAAAHKSPPSASTPEIRTKEAALSKMSVTDLIKQQTLGHRVAFRLDGIRKQHYYMPHSLDAKLQ